jgi:hypothetical protein
VPCGVLGLTRYLCSVTRGKVGRCFAYLSTPISPIIDSKLWLYLKCPNVLRVPKPRPNGMAAQWHPRSDLAIFSVYKNECSKDKRSQLRTGLRAELRRVGSYSVYFVCNIIIQMEAKLAFEKSRSNSQRPESIRNFYKPFPLHAGPFSNSTYT